MRSTRASWRVPWGTAARAARRYAPATRAGSVITGLVPVIPIQMAGPCHTYRDGRDKPGHDNSGKKIRHTRNIPRPIPSPRSSAPPARRCRARSSAARARRRRSARAAGSKSAAPRPGMKLSHLALRSRASQFHARRVPNPDLGSERRTPRDPCHMTILSAAPSAKSLIPCPSEGSSRGTWRSPQRRAPRCSRPSSSMPLSWR